MRWFMLVLTASWVLGLLPVAATTADEREKKPAAKTVIPFDFASKFDNGVYGQTIGDMIWKKLARRKGFVIPESMLDVREYCQRKRFLPTADTPLATMRDVVVKDNGGDIGIWGKIERVAGNDTDIYDLWIVIVDFSTTPPKTIHRQKARTKTVSEIPHLYVKEALNALYGQSEDAAAEAPPDTPAIKERWEKGPHLIKGDLDNGIKAPFGWDPLPQHVSWEKEGKNRFIRFTIPPPVAETTGVLYYSDFFPVTKGATYRFQCRFRTTGTAVKVFIKCYDEFSSTFSGKDKASSQKREVYRSQQNLAGAANQWHVHTEDFTPHHAKFTPRWGKVMLFAYYPAGTVEWDDVVVKQIVPVKAGR